MSKRKKCKYCEHISFNTSYFTEKEVLDNNSKAETLADYKTVTLNGIQIDSWMGLPIMHIRTMINYCPMCGRKLGDK